MCATPEIKGHQHPMVSSGVSGRVFGAFRGLSGEGIMLQARCSGALAILIEYLGKYRHASSSAAHCRNGLSGETEAVCKKHTRPPSARKREPSRFPGYLGSPGERRLAPISA